MRIKVDKCSLFYERWSVQCCGAPVHKDSRVEFKAEYYHPQTLGGWMHIDFHENHHDEVEYSLMGEVRDINAIFVDIVAKSGYTIDKDNNYKPVAIDFFDGYENNDAYAPFGNEPCGYYLELNNVEIVPS